LEFVVHAQSLPRPRRPFRDRIWLRALDTLIVTVIFAVFA
jgi:hypothetical protein